MITEIDVWQTMEETLGFDRRRHIVIGACSLKLTHAALDAEPDLGLLPPRDVAVQKGLDRVLASV